MGSALSLPVLLLNFLLPFTKPGTPLLQDLIHTAILCGTLYFAPQIAEWYNTRLAQDTPRHVDETGVEAEDDAHQDLDEPLRDERLILQDDGEEVVGPPPPLAPTPPPARQNGQPRQQAPPPQMGNFPVLEPLNNNAGFDDPGPANDRPRPTPANRVVGAKKAKSLARKDQRRAYHEFHRQEAELRRLQEQEGAEEREAALTAEKARRAQVEEEIRERERDERGKTERGGTTGGRRRNREAGESSVEVQGGSATTWSG